VIAENYKPTLWKEMTGKPLNTLAAEFRTSQWRPK